MNPHSAPSILLVDDEIEMLTATAHVLETQGYRVQAFTSALEAIYSMGTRDDPCDLVITDVALPGVRGTSLLAAVKTAFPKVPVIVNTAFGDWEQRQRVLAQGACEFLHKPIRKAELLAAVERALCRPHMAGS